MRKPSSPGCILSSCVNTLCRQRGIRELAKSWKISLPDHHNAIFYFLWFNLYAPPSCDLQVAPGIFAVFWDASTLLWLSLNLAGNWSLQNLATASSSKMTKSLEPRETASKLWRMTGTFVEERKFTSGNRIPVDYLENKRREREREENGNKGKKTETKRRSNRTLSVYQNRKKLKSVAWIFQRAWREWREIFDVLDASRLEGGRAVMRVDLIF